MRACVCAHTHTNTCREFSLLFCFSFKERSVATRWKEQGNSKARLSLGRKLGNRLPTAANCCQGPGLLCFSCWQWSPIVCEFLSQWGLCRDGTLGSKEGQVSTCSGQCLGQTGHSETLRRETTPHGSGKDTGSSAQNYTYIGRWLFLLKY